MLNSRNAPSKNTFLKPCPFCGYANPKMTQKRSGGNKRTGTFFQILCSKCKARGPIFTGKYLENDEFGWHKSMPYYHTIVEANQKAIDAWNTRIDDPIIAESLQVQLTEEAIREILKGVKEHKMWLNGGITGGRL